MSQPIDTTAPLITHFATRTLTELGIGSNTLEVISRYTPTTRPKAGLAGLIGKLPKMQADVAMDIDIGVGLYDAQGQVIQNVWYGNTRAHGDAVRHQGDSYHGLSVIYDTNQESISIRLSELDAKVNRVVIFVHSYHQQPLSAVHKGSVSLTDHEGTTLHEVDYQSLKNDTISLALWQLTRLPDDWRIDAPLTPIKAKTVLEAMNAWQIQS